jgi:hypothetical protein
LANISEEIIASIIRAIITLMIDAVGSSKMSVSIYQTIRRNIPEDSHLHTGRRENLKPHKSEFNRYTDQHGQDSKIVLNL